MLNCHANNKGAYGKAGSVCIWSGIPAGTSSMGREAALAPRARFHEAQTCRQALGVEHWEPRGNEFSR